MKGLNIFNNPLCSETLHVFAKDVEGEILLLRLEGSNSVLINLDKFCTVR